MNFVKRSLEGGGIKSRVEVLGEVKALLLPALDLTSTSLSCSPGMLAGELTQRLRWVVQNLGAIVIKGLNMILSNKLADPLDIELFRIVT